MDCFPGDDKLSSWKAFVQTLYREQQFLYEIFQEGKNRK